MVPIGAPAAAGTGASSASGLFGSSTASSGGLFGASSGAGAWIMWLTSMTPWWWPATSNSILSQAAFGGVHSKHKGRFGAKIVWSKGLKCNWNVKDTFRALVSERHTSGGLFGGSSASSGSIGGATSSSFGGLQGLLECGHFMQTSLINVVHRKQSHSKFRELANWSSECARGRPLWIFSTSSFSNWWSSWCETGGVSSHHILIELILQSSSRWSTFSFESHAYQAYKERMVKIYQQHNPSKVMLCWKIWRCETSDVKCERLPLPCSWKLWPHQGTKSTAWWASMLGKSTQCT